jgi:LysM repeat protein
MIPKPAGSVRALGKFALGGLVVLMLAFGPVAAVYADTTYKVQPGDTLISIAARYGVTVDAIVAANSLPSRSTIYAGQVLTIPSPGSNPAPRGSRTGPDTYTVQPGDTLSDIALLYGTTTDAIARANGLSGTTIYAGQKLSIPAPGSSAPPPAAPTANPQPQANPGTYVVQPGDSIIGVANRFGVTQQALAAANGLQPFDRLQIGQVLKIPGRGQPEPAAPTATPQPKPQPPPTLQPTTTPQPVSSEQSAEPGKPLQYTVQPGDNLSSIAARFNTTVASIMTLNKLSDGNFLRVGQVLTIVKGDDQNNNPPVNTPTPEPTPPMGQFGPKWIDVNISSQMMVAFEGQTPVFSARVSTGVPRHATVEGTYRIYARYRSTKMEGGQGSEYYYIPNVPYVMYFYSGYGLHGAYWHNNFGTPMSHGCVNLPVDAAKWMFEWAPIGTLVVTHK